MGRTAACSGGRACASLTGRPSSTPTLTPVKEEEGKHGKEMVCGGLEPWYPAGGAMQQASV